MGIKSNVNDEQECLELRVLTDGLRFGNSDVEPSLTIIEYDVTAHLNSSLIPTAVRSYESTVHARTKVPNEDVHGSYRESKSIHSMPGEHQQYAVFLEDRTRFASLDVERHFPTTSLARKFGVRHWIIFYIRSFLEQLMVVVPICGFIEIFSVLVLRTLTPAPGITVMAVVACVLGLGLFLEGLSFGVMPLGEAFGDSLRYVAKHSEVMVFMIAFGLGVGVTYAEPAVGVLRVEGKRVDPALDPYVYALLQLWPSTLVLTIALGVGVACVLGTMRILWDWPVKTLLHISALAAFALSVFLLFFTNIPVSALALAWDCGAVTTGPITVPLLLSLGAGLTPTDRSYENHSLGFVALASLFPVMAVMLLILWIHAYGVEISVHSVMGASSTETVTVGLWNDLIEAGIAAVISLGPLISFLVLLIIFFFRRPLPTVWATIEQEEASEIDGQSRQEESNPSPTIEALRANLESPVTVDMHPWPNQFLKKPTDVSPAGRDNARQSVSPLLFCVQCMIGLGLYKFGLEHGLTHMGNSIGGALPKATSLYPVWLGFLFVLLFALLLGFIATNAEPGLIIIENELKRMTSGDIDFRHIFRFWVPLGVATGLMGGVAAVIGGSMLAVLLGIMATYPISCAAGLRSPDLTAAAIWDAAGVTTGEVTVPLVLSLGAQMAREFGMSGGFGLLALASVLPIGLSIISTHFQPCEVCVTKESDRSRQTDNIVEDAHLTAEAC